MIRREVVVSELDRSQALARGTVAAGPDRATGAPSMHPSQTVRELPPQERIYGWMERAQAEGVGFRLEEYNARIPQDYVERALRTEAPETDLPLPWTEHFRPATEQDILSLIPGAD